MTERKAWACPSCGKTHAPHVDTCPETVIAAPHLPGLPDTNPIDPLRGIGAFRGLPAWPYTALSTGGAVINVPTTGLMIWN